MSLLCNQLTAATCPDDRKYVFWDSFHPTERAYEIICGLSVPKICREAAVIVRALFHGWQACVDGVARRDSESRQLFYFFI